MTAETPVWFITGCSTGFGREIAQAALRRGCRAVVTARNPARLGSFTAEPNALVTALDVTKPDQIAAAVQLAESRFGRIDVLVNNAGYGYLSAIEEGEDAEVRAMFEANVFGLIAVTKAVLPGMRARRRGHVFNISSIGGRIGFPGSGYYAATKFAVAGLSEALAAESAPLGIKVTSIEPGPFRTDWAGRSLKTPKVALADYAETAGKRRATLQGYSGKQPGDPARLAQVVIQAAESANPPLHLLLGRPAYEQAEQKLKALGAEMEAWRAASLSADFPDGE